MKYQTIIGCIILLFAGCIKEKYKPGDCWQKVYFVMEDVPYVFQNEEIIEYRPYYNFTERLDLLVFSGQNLVEVFRYDYEYCRSHPVIPIETGGGERDFLFAANLYDQKDLDWSFKDDQLKALFSIRDYEEPPVYLAAVKKTETDRDSLSVMLQMLVSRLEIRLVDPPAWVSGLDVFVRNIAGSVDVSHQLGDTTHIRKQMFFNNEGVGTYEFGVNTFPTYQGKAASISIDLIGTSETAPILVEDSRLHLFPGVITRLEIGFKGEQKITISVEIDGKWEIVDDGNIII